MHINCMVKICLAYIAANACIAAIFGMLHVASNYIKRSKLLF